MVMGQKINDNPGSIHSKNMLVGTENTQADKKIITSVGKASTRKVSVPPNVAPVLSTKQQDNNKITLPLAERACSIVSAENENAFELGEVLSKGTGNTIYALKQVGEQESSFLFKTRTESEEDDEELNLSLYLTEEEIEAIKPASECGVSIVEKQDLQEEVDDLQREVFAHENMRDHPNIAKCHGLVMIDGKTGLLLERVNGPDLDEVDIQLKKLLHQDRSTVISEENQHIYWGVHQELLKQMCQGVNAAHQDGIIHGDLKPDNMLLSIPKSPGEKPELKLIDFGYSTKNGEQQPTGHELFAAPESMVARLNGETVTARPALDSFCIGAMLGEYLKDVAGLNQTKQKSERLAAHLNRYKEYGGELDLEAEKGMLHIEKAPPFISESEEKEILSKTSERLQPVVQDAVALCNALTHADKEQRMSVEEALSADFFSKTLLDEKFWLSRENMKKIHKKLTSLNNHPMPQEPGVLSGG